MVPFLGHPVVVVDAVFDAESDRVQNIILSWPMAYAKGIWEFKPLHKHK